MSKKNKKIKYNSILEGLQHTPGSLINMEIGKMVQSKAQNSVVINYFRSHYQQHIALKYNNNND